MVQTPFEMLPVLQLRNKFSTFYGARKVFISPLRTCHWSIICQFENCLFFGGGNTERGTDSINGAWLTFSATARVGHCVECLKLIKFDFGVYKSNATCTWIEQT
jgi:hypothetical protein